MNNLSSLTLSGVPSVRNCSFQKMSCIQAWLNVVAKIIFLHQMMDGK